MKFLKYYQVEHNGRKAQLAPQEYKLLQELYEQGKPISSKELIKKTWAYEIIMQEDYANLRVHICRIRKKLGKSVIKVVRSLGYEKGE